MRVIEDKQAVSDKQEKVMCMQNILNTQGFDTTVF